VRRTLEKVLTQAILDGRLGDGSRARATLGTDGEVALELPEPAALVAAWRRSTAARPRVRRRLRR
jgi:hypothetical protein